MSAYSSAVLADTPIHYWRMADPGGALAHDIGSSPAQMHGIGNPLLGYTGPVSDGGSVDCALTGTYINTGIAVPFAGGQVTFECWVWVFQQLAQVGQFMYWSAAAPQMNLARTTTQWQFVYNGVSAVSTNNFTAQAWHHLVGTYDGANVHIYADAIAGTAPAAAAAGAFSNIFEISSSLAVGSYGLAFFAECAVYNYALTPTQVNNHFLAADNTSQSPIYQQFGLWDPGTGGVATVASDLSAILNSVRKTY